MKKTTPEQDLRLDLLNPLLTTPHRQLELIQPLHADMVKKDPLFYVRLAAWYNDHGEVRDHKEMFLITLVLSDFEGHRDAGLAMLRALPPYQLVRVVDFIHGTKETRLVERDPSKTGKTVSGRKLKRLKASGKSGGDRPAVRREVVGEVGLNRNPPRS